MVQANIIGLYRVFDLDITWMTLWDKLNQKVGHFYLGISEISVKNPQKKYYYFRFSMSRIFK